jgi:hypothetical protein
MDIINKIKTRLLEKIGEENPYELLNKKFKLFILIGISLVAMSKLLYFNGITFPNLELIIPTFVVIGSLSFYQINGRWKQLAKYFGFVALVGVFLIDFAFYGLLNIFVFTWSGFIGCWLLAKYKKLSIFDNSKKLVLKTTLTTASAILVFDIYTCFGFWLLYHNFSPVSLISVFIAQIPFTLYHLCSLVFVPPLIILSKIMLRVKVPVAVSVPLANRIKR